MSKKHRKRPRTRWGKLWYFLWHDDSLLSWLANIALAFVLIQFVIYPVMGAVFGSELPVVAVISSSMDQSFVRSQQFGNSVGELCGNEGTGRTTFDEYWNLCGDFYEDRGISQQEFSEFPLSRGFSKGDVIVLFGVDFESVQLGDVLVFQSNRAYPIIHRVVGIDEEQRFVETKGDHNEFQIQEAGFNERRVGEEYFIGRGVFRIPFIGYVKIIAVDALNFVLGR